MPKQRQEIEEKFQWDLTTVYPSDAAWEEEYKDLLSTIETGKDYAGRLLESAQTFRTVSELQLSLMRRIEKLYVYASMKNDQDTRVAKYQEFQAKANTAYSQFSQAFAYYEPEFLQITPEQLEEFYEAEPALQQYRHQLDTLLTKKAHVLSQEVEEVLAASSEIYGAASETFSVLDNASISFEDVADEQGHLKPLTHGTFISYMESKDRELRREAYENLYAVYEQFQHTYAKTLQTNAKYHNLNARLRHYSSAREAALAENFIPESVYDTLVSAVNKHLPLLQRYVDLRKKVLGLDDLKMYDIYTPLSEMDLSYTYEAALEKASETLSVFGEEYSSYVKAAFSDRWIDAMQNEGKRSGAYSGGFL
ncbi:Oligoendopeptidase F [Streptococcus sp. DD13]|nr:Oligoendopeptidase F [Streptococcus sp. DD13]